MGEQLLGSIMLFAGNFAPREWAYCDGQLMAIATNDALFSILGTTYGGDGRTTFGIPDLRGRAPIGARRGPGLSNRALGQRSGQEMHTLTTLEMPSHNHLAAFQQTSGTSKIPAVADTAGTDDPTNANLATPDIDNNNFLYSKESADTHLAPGKASVTGNVTTVPTGNSQGHNNMQPYLAINYIIAIRGLYPSRS